MTAVDTLVRLMTWLSPSFPVGAFSYSHGLERVIEGGAIRDVASLIGWLVPILEQGSARTDAILLACAWRANDWNDINQLAIALATTGERRLETTAQGTAFLRMVQRAWPHPRLAALAPPVAYPVAVGAAAAAHGLPLAPVLAAHVHAMMANLVSAAVRLVPLGQSDGLLTVARLEPLVTALARTAEDLGPEDLGNCLVRLDIASFRHETQYTRLFRT